jgi:hypothetical protein
MPLGFDFAIAGQAAVVLESITLAHALAAITVRGGASSRSPDQTAARNRGGKPSRDAADTLSGPGYERHAEQLWKHVRAIHRH